MWYLPRESPETAPYQSDATFVRCYRPPEGIIGRYLECDPDHTWDMVAVAALRRLDIKITTAVADPLLIMPGAEPDRRCMWDHRGSTSRKLIKVRACRSAIVQTRRTARWETYLRTFFSYLMEKTYKITV